MSYAAMDYVMAHSSSTATHKVVLLSIAQHANAQGEAWPSVSRLSIFAGVTERSVRNTLRDLEESGELTTTIRKGFGSGHLRTNLYKLAMPDCGCAANDQGRVHHIPAQLTEVDE